MLIRRSTILPTSSSIFATELELKTRVLPSRSNVRRSGDSFKCLSTTATTPPPAIGKSCNFSETALISSGRSKDLSLLVKSRMELFIASEKRSPTSSFVVRPTASANESAVSPRFFASVVHFSCSSILFGLTISKAFEFSSGCSFCDTSPFRQEAFSRSAVGIPRRPNVLDNFPSTTGW